MKTFTEWLENDAEDCGLCSPPLKAQEALQFLKNYLLGEDWYVTMPQNTEQCNTDIVHEILMKHSKEYRREFRNYARDHKRKQQSAGDC